MKILGVGTD